MYNLTSANKFTLTWFYSLVDSSTDVVLKSRLLPLLVGDKYQEIVNNGSVSCSFS